MEDLLNNPANWPMDDHLDVIFLGRALVAIAAHEAFADQDLRSLVLRSLIDGKLAAIIIASSGEYLTIPAISWRSQGAEQLYSCMMLESEVLGETVAPISVLQAIDRWRREARHIYITRASLDALLGKDVGAKPSVPAASAAARTKAEANAESDLRALVEGAQGDLALVPKRDAWVENCGLGPKIGLEIWGRLAKQFPEMSSKSKPRAKRTG